MDGIAVPLGPLQTFQRRAGLPHKGVHRANEAVADHQEGGVMLPFRDFDHLARQVEREFWPPYHQIPEAKAKERREAMHISTDARIEKPLSDRKRLDSFRRSIALEWQ